MSLPISIAVGDSVQLTEFRDSDESACVEYLNDQEIYRQTLKIPYRYTGCPPKYFRKNDEFIDAKAYALVVKWPRDSARGVLN